MERGDQVGTVIESDVRLVGQRAGYVPVDKIKSFRQRGSGLHGHPIQWTFPGVENTSGSLGQGLSMALGMALGARRAGKDFQVYALLSDGETQEGMVWEAAMAAPKWKLDNLTVIVDRNHLQNDFCVDEEMPIEPLADKWRAFNWHVETIDGHSMEAVVAALEAAKARKGVPTALIAETVKGKGVSFMENAADWHGKAPCQAEADQALDEIRRCTCEI